MLTREELILLIESRRVDAILRGDAAGLMIAELQAILLMAWEEESRRVTRDALTNLSRGSGTITLAEIEATIAGVAASMSVRYTALVEQGLIETIQVAYEGAQFAGARMSFNLTDVRALRWLDDYNVYWVRNHFDDHLRDKVSEIGRRVIDDGLGRREGGKLFQKELGETLGQSQSYWQGFSANVVTKSQEMSRVEGYVKAGVTSTRIATISDDRRSDVCDFLNGKVVPVELMVKLRDKLLDARSPEDVKSIKPWLKLEDVKAGVQGGKVVDYRLAFPDYHYFCRSRTVIHERGERPSAEVRAQRQPVGPRFAEVA